VKFAAKVASLVNPANIPLSSTSTTTGSIVNAGGFGNAGDIFNGGNINIASGKVYKINGNQVVGARGAALTAQLTTLTASAPGTPDYAITAGNNGAGTADEWCTVISVIANLQTRVSELEARLSSAAGHGLIAAP
jgi:hypothetical protein